MCMVFCGRLKMGMCTNFVVLLLVCFVYHGDCLKNALTVDEINQYAAILQDTKCKTLEQSYHVVRGLKALNKDVAAPEDVCNLASSNVDKKDPKSVFQMSEIAKLLNCKSILSTAANLVFDADETDVKSISYAIASSVNFGLKVKETLVKSLENALKNDDSPSSAAMAFYAGSLLPKENKLKFLTDLVEDVIAQADEIDNSLMKFESGLSLTSDVIKGVLALADQQEKQSSLTEDQIMKFAQYFLDRKYVMDIKSIYDVATALSHLASNKFQVPAVVSVFKTDRLTEKNRIFKVRVTDVMDKSIPNVKVVAKSIISSAGNTISENVPLVDGPEDDYIIVKSSIAKGYIAAHSHIYDFGKSGRGIYTLNMNVDFPKSSKKFIGGKDVKLMAKVLSRITIDDIEIGVTDRDKSAPAKPTKIKFPESLKSEVEADFHQKIVMKFILREQSGTPTSAHQTFIRLTHKATGQEIFFVAQAEDNVYKFNLDLGATGKDSFNNLSGKYKMDLIVGDALVQIPIKWPIGSISLTFSEDPKKTKKEARIIGPRPVIEHMFRVPEKRPPILVSNIFTALIIVPFIVMIAMWVKIGANVSNFEFGLSSIVFHIGLAGIFVLYYMFWTKLNMFTTLKGLAVIGGATFLGGNKMLAAMAARKQSRS